jgi:hypothetical protein
VKGRESIDRNEERNTTLSGEDDIVIRPASRSAAWLSGRKLVFYV